ncbi:MAG: hypothetical protein JWP27_291 [Flaviaesturariibacter sp.]|nr:hypothetical protein [Flaviaesturariibacter sp.]
MCRLFLSVLCLFLSQLSFSQAGKARPTKYPSLLWEIRGKGLKKPSYLFGTMHVSSKMVFNLSDSFYLGIRSADVVAIEVNPDSWQKNMNRYDINPMLGNGYLNANSASAKDFLHIGTLAFANPEKAIEQALSSNPSVINNLLYRAGGYGGSDFQEDTYLDMHIFQTGKRWGKRVAGVEDFDRSMQLMMEAYIDAAKEQKNSNRRATDIPDDLSFSKLQDAYRNGNLDLLDTINKVNSSSSAFDEKFLYLRNVLQASSIDSIIRSGSSLFVGVGAAHLPGHRGVIELLRQKGYTLRPIRMVERDSRFKDEAEKIRVPVTFATQTTADAFVTVKVPGPLYDNRHLPGTLVQQQYADMGNGSYYMLTRVPTDAPLWGLDTKAIYRKVDSVLYENIPGKILTKKTITRNGYDGFDITNRTRRGDLQRYQVFVTPFEVLVFKMSGTADYISNGPEADTFFNSIRLKPLAAEWTTYTPASGGFEALFPQLPLVSQGKSWQFMALDPKNGNAYEVLRTDIHNYDFIGRDTIDLDLMDESFASSEFIDKSLGRKRSIHAGFPALDVDYLHKDGSVSKVRYVIQGPHYYTLIAHGKKSSEDMSAFLNSFRPVPVRYGTARAQRDTVLHFSVTSPVSVVPKEIEDLPFDAVNLANFSGRRNDEDSLVANAEHKNKMVASDTTGERIYVAYWKASPYFFDTDSSWVDFMNKEDALDTWVVRSKSKSTLPGGIRAWDYVITDSASSRAFRCRLMYRNGVAHKLITQIDTSASQSAFINTFFATFMPEGGDPANDVFVRKSDVFFKQYFSRDTLQHRRALKNISNLVVDSSDLPGLARSIAGLGWKERAYIDVKKQFLNKVGEIKTKAATDYLVSQYKSAGDTLDLQHVVLENLLQQRTAYAYEAFRDIVTNDPPVLNVDGDEENYRGDEEEDRNGMFIDNLSDSLKLTATIFRDLLPLVNIDDYKQPIMSLLGEMIDSNLVTGKDYEMYLQKFLLEGKQAWKKQSISEKSKSIAAAQKKDDEDEDDDNGREYGNADLNLYATLLLPFWDTHPAVPQLINQMLGSTNKRFKYNLAYLLMRHNKPLPDTLLRYYAGLTEYRHELYTDLIYLQKAGQFPKGFDDKVSLARSQLATLQSYQAAPDTLIYLDRLPVTYRRVSGHFYFFKYKDKKTDNSWKIAVAGLIPADGKMFSVLSTDDPRFTDKRFNFAELTDTRINEDEPLRTQLQKALKRQLYTKVNSAEEFYNTERNYTVDMAGDD